jgi:hypothetical protein
VGSTKVVARNIAVGHVILASGQSNIFISLADIKARYPNSNWASLAQQALNVAPANKALRLFKVSGPLGTPGLFVTSATPRASGRRDLDGQASH